MSSEPHKLSVIIPSPPGVYPTMALQSLKKLSYPDHNIEVLIAEGKQPAKQRNEAIKRATGDIIFFFDDDATIHPDVVDKMLRHYDDEKVAVVGGPNLTPETDSRMQKYFGRAMSFRFSCAQMSTRYKQEGKPREGDEKNLILCNLSARTSVLRKEGAFVESLWPNEENELFHRLQTRGWKLIYEPEAVVYHSRRSTVKAFAKQLFGYGRGRMEQTLLQPSSFRPVFLIPTLFVFYLLSLPFVLAFNPLPWYSSLVYGSPGIAYVALCLLVSAKSAWDERDALEFLWFLFLIPLIHISYGLGFVYGLCKKILRRSTTLSSQVTVQSYQLDADII